MLICLPKSLRPKKSKILIFSDFKKVAGVFRQLFLFLSSEKDFRKDLKLAKFAAYVNETDFIFTAVFFSF
jgi:hypothetical protein